MPFWAGPSSVSASFLLSTWSSFATLISRLYTSTTYAKKEPGERGEAAFLYKSPPLLREKNPEDQRPCEGLNRPHSLSDNKDYKRDVEEFTRKKLFFLPLLNSVFEAVLLADRPALQKQTYHSLLHLPSGGTYIQASASTN